MTIAKPYRTRCWFYIPDATAKAGDHVPWSTWQEMGHCQIITKPTISKQVIIDKYQELCDEYNIVSSMSDKFGYPEIMQIAEDNGVDLDSHEAVAMNLKNNDEGIKKLQQMLFNRDLAWQSPVLTFCIDNCRVSVAKSGALQIDRIKSKRRASSKIDGASCLMLCALMVAKSSESSFQSGLDLSNLFL